MNKAYKQYLMDTWKEAEALTNVIGCTSNSCVIAFFDKIAQPYYYWQKGE